MESERRLRDHRSVTLSASGTGTVTFGPNRPNTSYLIQRVAVKGSTTTIPTAGVYRGKVAPENFISGTKVGNDDADGALDELLYPGEFLSVYWEGGTSGNTVTATFSGVERVGE